MKIPEWCIAVTDFGGYVQRAAVRYGKKKDLAEAAGTTEEVICLITSGNANKVERPVLIKVAIACRKKLGQKTLPIMIVLINKIHPQRATSLQQAARKRIQYPLTHAERRLQAV